MQIRTIRFVARHIAAWTRLAMVVFVAMVWSSREVSAREWVDITGKFRVEADLVDIRVGKAYLEKRDGVVLSVALTQLSKADLRHLLSLREYRDYFETHLHPEINPLPSENGASDQPNQRFPTIDVDDESILGEIRRFHDKNWSVHTLAFSPDGRFLVAGQSDGSILVFNIESSELIDSQGKLEGLGKVTCLVFTPDGSKLLSGGNSGRIHLWNVSPNGYLSKAKRFEKHTQAVKSITISADGAYVLSGGDGKRIRYWSLADFREKFIISGFSDSVKATFLSRSGKQGLACDGNLVALIDIESGKAIQTMILNAKDAQSLVLSPDGSRVVANLMHALHSWHIRTGKGYPILQDEELQWSAAFSSNNRYLLSGGDGKVNLWDFSKHAKIYEFDMAGKYYVQTLACSPTNRYFAAVSGSTGKVLQVFRLPACVAKE